MKYNSQTLEQEAVLQTARQICAAVRTAPKNPRHRPFGNLRINGGRP